MFPQSWRFHRWKIGQLFPGQYRRAAFSCYGRQFVQLNWERRTVSDKGEKRPQAKPSHCNHQEEIADNRLAPARRPPFRPGKSGKKFLGEAGAAGKGAEHTKIDGVTVFK